MGIIHYGVARVLTKLFRPKAILNSTGDKTASIGAGTQLVSSVIGRYSYVAGNASIVHTEIGSFCSIAAGVTIGGASHPVDWASSSPVFHSGRNSMHKHFATHEFEPYKKTVIGSDVWVGSNCLIKGGVTIGHGAVIGMGSVVTKDVPPYAIVGGNPAKLIRMRFDSETCSRLLASEWWSLDEATIEKLADTLMSPERFLEALNSLNKAGAQ